MDHLTIWRNWNMEYGVDRFWYNEDFTRISYFFLPTVKYDHQLNFLYCTGKVILLTLEQYYYKQMCWQDTSEGLLKNCGQPNINSDRRSQTRKDVDCAVQCGAVQYIEVQCSVVQGDALQFGLLQWSAVQWSAMQCSAVQFSAGQWNAV